MANIETLKGKPFTITKNGKRLQIGTIVRAYATRDGLHIDTTITDPDVKAMLGSATRGKANYGAVLDYNLPEGT